MAKANTTRETILGEALAQAVVVGLEGLSIGGLAEALGLSKSGLFAHFKSKEALQLAVLEAAIQRFAARVVRPAMASIRGCRSTSPNPTSRYEPAHPIYRWKSNSPSSSTPAASASTANS